MKKTGCVLTGVQCARQKKSYNIYFLVNRTLEIYLVLPAFDVSHNGALSFCFLCKEAFAYSYSKAFTFKWVFKSYIKMFFFT